MRPLALLAALALGACAQNGAEPTSYDTADAKPPGDASEGPEDASADDVGASDTSRPDVAADAGDEATAGDSGPPPDAGPSAIKYECPVHLSQGCADGSLCESTCLGQFQDGASCTWYMPNAVPVVLACTAVTTIGSIYFCPSQLSSGCADSSACESACVAQYQSAGTCAVRSPNGVPSSITCTPARGTGAVPLYRCPVTRSTGCADTSVCQSTCVGQISHAATCTSRGPNGVGTDVACTPLGSESF